MDHSARVRRLEPAHDLASDRQRLAERKWAGTQPPRQRFALDQLHDQEPDRRPRLIPDEPARPGVRHGLAEFVDLRHVRMVERRQRARLAFEARNPIGVGRHALGEHLECHVPPQPEVAGAPNLAHSAPAEDGYELEAGEKEAGTQHDCLG